MDRPTRSSLSYGKKHDTDVPLKQFTSTKSGEKVEIKRTSKIKKIVLDSESSIIDNLLDATLTRRDVHAIHALSDSTRDVSTGLSTRTPRKPSGTLSRVEILRISTNGPIKHLDSLLVALNVCPKLKILEIESKQDIQCRRISNGYNCSQTLKVLSLHGTNFVFDVATILCLTAELYPSLRECAVKGGIMWIKSSKRPRSPPKSTSVEIMRISSTHTEWELNLQELFMLLSASCQGLLRLELEAGKYVLGDLHNVQIGEMLLPLLENLELFEFTVKDPVINEEQRFTLVDMVCPHLRGDTTVLWKSRSSTWGNIDHRGGKLCVESYGFTFTVPKGALDQSTFLSIRVLTEGAGHADFQIDSRDTFISYGVCCSPAGQKFKTPVKIEMPHCANFIGKEKGYIVMYWEYHDKKSGRTSFRDDSNSRRHGFNEEKLWILLEHFCKVRPALSSGEGGSLVEKTISLKPFLPDRLPDNRQPILRVRLYDTLPGSQDDTDREERDLQNHAIGAEECRSIAPESSDFSIQCFIKETEQDGSPQTISAHDLRRPLKRTETFVLDLKRHPDNSLIKLLLRHRLNSPADVRHYYTGYIAPAETQPGCSTTSGASSAGSQSHSRSRQRPEDSEPVTEEDLEYLCRRLPRGEYYIFALATGLLGGKNEADSILQTNGGNHRDAYRDVVHIWKNRTAQTLESLRSVCDNAGLLGVYDSFIKSKERSKRPRTK